MPFLSADEYNNATGRASGGITYVRRRWQVICGAAFLSTGAGLLAYIASGISLLVTAVVSCALGGLAICVVAPRLSEGRRRLLNRRIAAGVVAGLLATVAYDLSRFALIELTGIRFWPFDIFRVFGQALIGDGFTDPVTRTVGFLYHVANGVGFGIAFTIWLGHRGVLAGIAFAMALELCMVTVYPGWLEMKALEEFLQVSVVGHLVYGVVLGYSARHFGNAFIR
jgi:hypothetical protein